MAQKLTKNVDFQANFEFIVESCQYCAPKSAKLHGK